MRSTIHAGLFLSYNETVETADGPEGLFSLGMPRTFLTALIILLIILSAFFSASETALLSASRIKLKHRARKGERKAKQLIELLSRPDRLLGTILVGNNFVNVSAVAIATYLAGTWISDEGQGILLVSVAMTIILLLFGEITPKTVAARYPLKVSLFVLPVVRATVRALRPVVRAVTVVSNAMVGLFRMGKGESFPSMSEEEIKAVIHIGYEEGVVAKGQRRMLSSILELSEIRVREVMIPRTMITALEVNTSFQQVLETIRKTGHSRFPVYEEDLERIVGVVHSKDLVRHWDERSHFSLKRVMAKPFFVPESARLETLLLDMQKNHAHLAVVVDEYGGLEGIVTLEDLLEEIVGEIQDEYDQEKPLFVRDADGTILVEGKAPIKELNEGLQLSLEGGPGHTLAGLILTSLGRIPEPREEVVLNGLSIRIEEVSKHTIRKVRIMRIEKPAPLPEGEEG